MWSCPYYLGFPVHMKIQYFEIFGKLEIPIKKKKFRVYWQMVFPKWSLLPLTGSCWLNWCDSCQFHCCCSLLGSPGSQLAKESGSLGSLAATRKVSVKILPVIQQSLTNPRCFYKISSSEKTSARQSSFLEMGDWRTERLKNLPQVTQTVFGRARKRTQISWVPVQCLNSKAIFPVLLLA